jgi:hypothetical protein
LQLKEMLSGSGASDERAVLPFAAAAAAAAAVWEQSSECLVLMGSVLVEEQISRQANCKAETLAAAMLQQLEQSGK